MTKHHPTAKDREQGEWDSPQQRPPRKNIMFINASLALKDWSYVFQPIYITLEGEDLMTNPATRDVASKTSIVDLVGCQARLALPSFEHNSNKHITFSKL
jgi:hypothetical protein